MKHTTLLTLVCGLSLAAVAATAPPATGRKPTGPRPAPDGSRFLFIVDTSSSMKPIGETERQTLFDLIFSGVDGYMRTGDTIGIWTFNDQVGAGRFPMQVWDGDNPVEVATRATKFLREQEYAGNNQVEDLMMKLTAIIRAVTNLNILILSDGDTKMVGTVSDAEINAAYATRGKERKAAKKPFITTLIVQGGKVTNGKVTLAGESIQLPQRPARVTSVKASAPKTTNAPSPRATSAPVPPKPRADAAPVEPPPADATAQAQFDSSTAAADSNQPASATVTETTSTKGAEFVSAAAIAAAADHSASDTPLRAGEASNARNSAPVPKSFKFVTHSNSVPAKVKATVSPAAAPPATTDENVETALAPGTVVAASTPTSLAVAGLAPSAAPVKTEATTISNPTSAVPAATAAVESKAAVLMAPAPIVVAAREVTKASTPTTQPPQNPVIVMQVQPGLGAMATLIIGGILLAMSLFLLGLALRRMRPAAQGSLITQSMHRR